MELLIADLSDDFTFVFQDDSGAFLDVCVWDGIECDDAGLVRHVRWYYMDATTKGSIHFAMLPDSLASFALVGDLSTTNIEGKLETSALPRGLTSFKIARYECTGTVDLTSLPSGVIDFSVQSNFFSGSANLTSLPQNLNSLQLFENTFSGSVSLDFLPATLKAIGLRLNSFVGELSFCNLPENLYALTMDKNKFSGKFSLLGGRSMPNVNAANNDFDGVAAVPKGYARQVYLRGNRISRVVNEFKEEHPKSDEFLFADRFVMVTT